MKFKNLFEDKKLIMIKLLLNQFAFSLFGIFVATPFSSTLCIIAGIFSLLFYIFVVGYAILDDSQKDRISFNAGRKGFLNSTFGFKYAYISFFPSIILTVVYTVLTFALKNGNSLGFILGLINKYAICGEVLGIDVGLTNYTYDAVNNIRVTTASDAVIFMSEHGLIQLAFTLVIPCILGIIYYLGFTGKVSVNTTEIKK